MTEQTDRELLEMAAKAAGMDCDWEDPERANTYSDLEGMWLKGKRSPDNSKYWNPLNDAGDALRLAAAINQLDLLLLVGKMVADGADAGTTGVAAICRAITYAAAQFGKAMP